MKASEVLRRYAAGERDFRRTNLRGQSFKEQHLSGADFSEADIRGTDFRNAVLKDANFAKVKAGVQKRWIFVQQAIAFALAVLFGAMSSFLGGLIPVLLVAVPPDNRLITAVIIFQGLIVFTFVAIIRQGFTVRLLGTLTSTLTIATVGIVTSLVTGVGLVADPNEDPGSSVLVLVGMIGIVLIFMGTFIGVVASLFAEKLAPATVVGAVSGAGVMVALACTGIIIFEKAYLGIYAVVLVAVIAVMYTSAILLLSFYIARRAFKKDKKFSLIHTLGIALEAIGGNSFCGSNLVYANFSNAILKGSNFISTKQKQTLLTQVYWGGVKQLDKARHGDSMLSNSAVCELLTTRNGYKKSYIDANLRGANLDGVNLNQANLKGAVLSEATLNCAELRNVDLTETLAIGTDFNRALLTGACLKAWNIDDTTKLANVDCQYVFLKGNRQERRPSSGDFAPGEFTKLFQEVLSTVDLIFRNGIDWKAFEAALRQVQIKKEDTPLEIQSIENKGDGMVVVRVKVPPDLNKEEIYSEIIQKYELELKRLETFYQSKLHAKESEIAIYREQSADMWEVIKLQSKQPINIQAIAEAKSMSNSNDSSQTVNIDGNVTGSTINLGTISGAVTNTINQLPETSDPDQPNLKQLLMQLKEAIKADPDLPDTDKADLLEQVQNLAEAKQTEEPAQKEGLTRRAKKMFEATLKSLPDTAKIVEASSKLLPLILKALGFSV